MCPLGPSSMSVAPLFPEKPVKIVVPTGVSCRGERHKSVEMEGEEMRGKIKPKSQQLQQPPCEFNNGRELMHTSYYCCHTSPLVYKKGIKKKSNIRKGEKRCSQQQTKASCVRTFLPPLLLTEWQKVSLRRAAVSPRSPASRAQRAGSQWAGELVQGRICRQPDDSLHYWGSRKWPRRR